MFNRLPASKTLICVDSKRNSRSLLCVSFPSNSALSGSGLGVGKFGHKLLFGLRTHPVGQNPGQGVRQACSALNCGFQTACIQIAAVCHAESYIGLVEVVVGLIPGGGGTKEFALRASESFFEGDVQIPTLVEKLKVIATATVSTSVYEGFKHGYLQHDRDVVEMNLAKVLSTAKEKVLDLAKNYTALQYIKKHLY